MPSTTLFATATHRNVLLPDFSEGAAVQANQHLIIDSGEGLVLDPGGHKVYAKVLNETFAHLGGGKLKHLFLSHQDPDIVAAVNGWLMTTDATAWCSELWTRFIPHFGVDKLVIDRLKGLPDRGGELKLGTTTLRVLPAHFLHSPGNFQLYDPVAKVLYSGDLGASLGQSYVEVPDFDQHLPFMEGFHRRYMSGNAAMKAWAKLARTLDLECIAPQHGAIFKGRPMVERFIEWCDKLACGVDLSERWYAQP